MRAQVLAWLAENVTASRVNHIIRVEQMAVELAVDYDLDREQAAMAGLMHDLAKYFKPQQLLQMALQDGLEVDEVMEANPHLLHAEVSAIVARDVFGVKDEEVLQAIANHTLGRPAMSKLSCIVFLADSLEPGRGESDQLEVLRRISRQNIDQCVWKTCDYTLKLLLDTSSMIHPRVIATRNWFLAAWKSKSAKIQPIT